MILSFIDLNILFIFTKYDSFFNFRIKSHLQQQLKKQINKNNIQKMLQSNVVDKSLQTYYLYQQPEPNLAIKIQPLEQNSKHTFICECEMCHQYEGKKINQILQHKTDSLNQKIKQKVQAGQASSEMFLDIVKKLTLPHHKIVKRGIDIYIPQICFFKDGQSKGLFLNRQLNDFNIKKVQKNSVNPGLIAKYFNDRRKQYRQSIKKALGITDRKVLSRKSLKSLKSISESILNFDQKDAVVIKHTDGFETLVSQTQFIMLTLRRKQDPIWKSIQMIKNTINIMDQQNGIIFVKYFSHNIAYQNLFQRCKTLMKIYGQNILPGDKDYISPEQQLDFSLELVNKKKSLLAQYTVYKIVNWIQYFYDEEITKLSCKILINQLNKPYLIDVTSLRKKTLVKYSWTNQTYKQKMTAQEQKMFINRAIEVNQQLENKAKSIQGIMEDKYSKMKNTYGITLKEQNNQEEQKNNLFFRKIHPQIGNINLSQLFSNEKNLSVYMFRKKYLGQKSQKKPIVKDFQNQMINMIHKTTPQLKVSNFHEISVKPFQIGLLSSRRPATSFSSQRKSFFGNQKQNTKRPLSTDSTNKNRRLIQNSSFSTQRGKKQTGCHLHMSLNYQQYLKNHILHK